MLTDSEWIIINPKLIIGIARPLETLQVRGYITSTPKSAEFPKKWPKTAKNERASCMPVPKIGERPYLAPPKTQFSDPIFTLFCPQLSILFHLPKHPAYSFYILLPNPKSTFSNVRHHSAYHTYQPTTTTHTKN